MKKAGWSIAAGLLLGAAASQLFALMAHAETQPYLHSAHIAVTQQQPAQATVNAKGQQEFWIVTNEIKSPAKGDLPEMESYRWDPGFLVVNKGEPVTLHFYGIKGKSHPFEIVGLGVKGNAEKGKISTVTFTPQKAGTYPIVCLTHPDVKHNGPMIGYLRVE